MAYASEKVRDDLPAAARPFYDIGVSLGAMAPIIAVGAASGGTLAPESRRIAYQAGLRESTARGNSDEATNHLNNMKILWNSWNNHDKISINGQLYAKIGDRLYSKHARYRYNLSIRGQEK